MPALRIHHTITGPLRQAWPLFLLALGLVILLALPMRAEAAVRDGLVISVNCEGFASRGGSILLDRDNTGAGREQIVFRAEDGSGNVIFQSVPESFLVRGRLTYPVGQRFAWSTAPQSNPLVVRVISLAGNGLEEQIVYSTVGACTNLTTATSATTDPNADLARFQILNGETSPSVPLNAAIPRPANPPLSLEQVPGYLVVNTGSLNIRSGDSPIFTIVGRVPGGTELLVLGTNEDRSWWYVQVGDIIGWVSGQDDLVFIRGDLTDVPVVEVRGEIRQPSFILFSTQHLRSVPDTRSIALCDLPGNLEYFVVGRTEVLDWYEITATCGGETVTGWVEATSGAIRNPAELRIPVTD